MTRPKNSKTQQHNEISQEEFNYVYEFAKTLNSWSYLLNPIVANQTLKNLNMNPSMQDRDNVKNMVYNPKEHEQSLRRLSEHLYNTQTPYKRLLHYFADMLKFEISIYPTNATAEEMKTDRFKKEYEKIWTWLDGFDYKREFKKILLGMMLEDGKYTYLRKDAENYMTLQEIPSDFALIDAWSEYGWLYSFNLMYFQQTGVDVNGFAPEFKKWYKQALEIQKNKAYYPNIKPEQRNGRWFYWQQISPDDGWVFKFDYTFAGLVPPFLGIFLDAIDIDTYKGLQKSKTVLEAYKMIIGTVPRNKDGTNKSGASKDDFAVNPNTLANFMQLVKSDLPEGLLFKAMPLDNMQAFSFDNNSNQKDIVGSAIKNFYRQTGADQNLFNTDRPNVATMKASTRIDAAFAEMVYPQFQCFLNYHLNKQTKRFKFSVKLSGTIFDEQERFDNAISQLGVGIITPDIPAALGLTERELRNGISLMSAMGYPNMFTPVQTSATLSSKNGRPEKSDNQLGDAGATTRSAGSNEE